MPAAVAMSGDAPVTLAGVGAGWVTTATVNSGSSIAVSKPSNLASGMAMLATVEHQNAPPNAVTGVPDGWTQIAAVGNAQSRLLATYIKPVPDADAETATSYTWTFSQTARIVGGVFLVNGSDGSAEAPGYSATTATLTAPSVTPSEADGLLVYVGVSNAAGGGQAFNPPSGMTEVIDVSAAPSSSTNLEVAVQELSDTTATGTRATTIASGPAFSSGGAYQFVLLPGRATPETALVMARQGQPDEDAVRAVVEVEYTDEVRLAVFTSSSGGSPVAFSDAETPDGDGYAQLEVGGLSAGTGYWWEVELDGELTGDRVAARTLPAAGQPAGGRFVLSSCCFTGSNNAVFDEIRGLNPDLFFQLGDWHYNWSSTSPNGSVAPNDQAALRAAYETSMRTARQATLLKAVPSCHSWSDNDFGGSNSDSTWAGVAAAQAMWRQIMSHPPLPHSAGIYRSLVWGRMRVIITDSRSFMSNKNAADSSSKHYYGTEQEDWFYDQLLQPEPVKLWLTDSKWTGSPITTANSGVDYPAAYPAFRTRVASFITTNAEAIGLLVMGAGDIHAIWADDGTNNTYGLFPAFGVAPLDQNTQPYPHAVQQTYPPAGDTTNTTRHQYVVLDIADSGSEIELQIRGWSDGVQRVSLDLAKSTTLAGTLVGTLPALGGELTGATITAGSIDGALPSLDGQLVGTAAATGTAGGVLPLLGGGLLATVSNSATLAADLPPLIGGLAAEQTTGGSLAGEVPALSGSAAGSAVTSGTLAGTLPPLSGGLTAATATEAVMVGALPAIGGELTGHMATAGALSGELSALTGAIKGAATSQGNMHGSLPALGGNLTAAAAAVGALHGALPSLVGDLTTATGTTGQLNGGLPQVTGAHTGTVTARGTAAGQLPPLAGYLSAACVAEGVLNGTLPALAGAAIGTTTVRGQLHGALPPLAGQISGVTEETVGGQMAGVLPALRGRLEGELAVLGVLEALLPAMQGGPAVPPAWPPVGGRFFVPPGPTGAFSTPPRVSGDFTVAAAPTGQFVA